MNKKEKICKCIKEKKDIFIDASNKIWEYAELGFHEFKSSNVICSVLEEEGFDVKKGLAGIETAFVGTFGSGHPVIGGNGHGCGHSLLGAGSLAAAVAVKEYMKEREIKGTVQYYGCPGEEHAALMTGTSCEIIFDQGVSDYIPNKVLGEILHKNLIESGAPDFDEYDFKLAQKFRETFSQWEVKNSPYQVQLFQGLEIAKKMETKVLSDLIGPFIHIEKPMPGSTDVGDVSYVVPTAQVIVACSAIGTSAHTWQMTAQSSSTIGYKGM